MVECSAWNLRVFKDHIFHLVHFEEFIAVGCRKDHVLEGRRRGEEASELLVEEHALLHHLCGLPARVENDLSC